MGAESKVENANLAIWNALSKTDPAATKGFSRAGGFKGTAIKPIWIVKMLTEQFGPCGTGWGMGFPKFRTVQGDGEILVYCTVPCWAGSQDNMFFGVGGDKVLTRRKDGAAFHDDEAFKKAFTDAVGNAFKFIGVGADVHMGLFDDSKYVEAVNTEYRERDDDPPAKVEGITKIKTALRALKTAGDKIPKDDVGALESFNVLVNEAKDPLTKIRDANHGWWTGDGEDFEGFRAWIMRRRAELSEPDSEGFKMLIESMKTCDTKMTLENWRSTNERFIEELDDADGRKFQATYDAHESAIQLQDTVGV